MFKKTLIDRYYPKKLFVHDYFFDFHSKRKDTTGEMKFYIRLDMEEKWVRFDLRIDHGTVSENQRIEIGKNTISHRFERFK